MCQLIQMNCIEEVEQQVLVKKRGRKSKQDLETQVQLIVSGKENDLSDAVAPIAKKRGRKPKGGKLVISSMGVPQISEDKQNIILHLKCSSKDLLNNVSNNDKLEIESYNFASKNELLYGLINKEPDVIETMEPVEIEQQVNTTNMKEVWRKLKRLEHMLHTNNVLDTASACFWCTYEFDNPAVYIPKHYIGETYHVYGCFCSPECAVAHLMNETIDSSTKFERYQFMNNIYGKIFNYTKNIKPAPNPHYMLEKFCGNLNIQEYRSLLRNERLFIIVDKPLTRVLPELHEDNDDFILNTKIIPSNYQLKKKQIKKCSKNSIVNEHFGIVS
jgi:hypothetical protein